MTNVFVLVHGPPVGPFVWSRVAAELRRRGRIAVVPELADDDRPLMRGQRRGASRLGAREADGRAALSIRAPYWRQHAESVARALAPVGPSRPLVLAGYSAAGPILPTIGALLGRPVAAYVFVDAGLPGKDGESRLDLRPPSQAAEVRAALAAGRRFPDWSDADVADDLPDPELRRAVLAELKPRPAEYHEEPLPVPRGWPDAPCSFVRFSAGYELDAARARALGWPVRDLPGGHFHLLLEAAAVADALLELTSA